MENDVELAELRLLVAELRDAGNEMAYRMEKDGYDEDGPALAPWRALQPRTRALLSLARHGAGAGASCSA